MSDLTVHPVALLGGLEDSKAKPEPSDLQRLENFSVFRGRFALRAPLTLVNTLTSFDANATSVLGGNLHDNKMFLFVYRDANDDVRLWELSVTGLTPVDRGAIWTGITAIIPRPVSTSFEGGSATSGTKRLYIADYDGQQITKFWNGTSIASLQVDFDNSGAAEDVKFHYVSSYQFHVWGAGFLQGTTGRTELLRFSRPGLIPEDDPDTSAGDLVEWFVNDFRPVGQRGDKITHCGYAGGRKIVFKNRQTYGLYGFDSSSWAISQLSERVGAVGPYAAASTGDGLCYFWSERGPHVTDGQQVVDISEKVRKHVLEAEVSDKTVVGFSPDDGQIYFVYPRGGNADPDRYLAFDTERKLYSEGEWLATGGGILRARQLFTVPSIVLPGPVAAPSGLTATGVAEDYPGTEKAIDLAWANGDQALDTDTEVYLDTSNPPTTLVQTVESGIASWRQPGLVSKTTYFGRVLHKRNNQFSGYSNVPSARTALTRPFPVSGNSFGGGVRVNIINNETGADIVLQRRLAGEGAFSTLTTLLAQPSGLVVYDDISGVTGAALYRAKVTLAGEADSGFSNTLTVFHGAISSVLEASHVTYFLFPCAIISITWTVVVGKATDMARISRSIDGAAYTVLTTVPLLEGAYSDETVGWRVGSTSRTVQYKVETLDNGDIVVDTDFTGSSAHNVDTCP